MAIITNATTLLLEILNIFLEKKEEVATIKKITILAKLKIAHITYQEN